MKKIEDSLIDLQVERQAGPIEKAQFARSQGAPGLAIAELEEADRGNMSPAVVKPQLVDLYCNTGQPDKALELLSMGASDDPNLGAEPGMSFMRQGPGLPPPGQLLSRPPRSGKSGRSPGCGTTGACGPSPRPRSSAAAT